ncbi:MAG: hypothetical protein L6305_00080 [Actinomycetia bacterium]|nr:hypothetical protein [bacterium]MCG2790136.1 hypothetical protein [Actinomycetes bacterium]
MKNYFHRFITLVISFSLFFLLIGCSGLGIPDTEVPIIDEVIIENVVNDFFLALNAQDWDKAKSYCVIDSIWYDFVSNLETFTNDIYIIEFSFSISSFYFVTGCTCPPLGIVFGELFATINEEVQEFPEEIITLQKINNNWQLFSDELPAGLVI